jgi:hypothetical protein
MGQQQLLLVILAVIIVGIAIAIGLSLFSAHSIQSNKDAMIDDLNNIAAHAYQFRMRPISMAGSAGTYTGYVIPKKLTSNPNGKYSCVVAPNEITLKAISVEDTTNSITCKIDSEGRFVDSEWKYTGNFQ